MSSHDFEPGTVWLVGDGADDRAQPDIEAGADDRAAIGDGAARTTGKDRRRRFGGAQLIDQPVARGQFTAAGHEQHGGKPPAIDHRRPP